MASTSNSIIHETSVLVVGAGPVGLLTSLQLARHEQGCMLVERNNDTTKWPKMDVTNARSMELLRNLGLSEGLRKQGVDEKFSFNVLFSSGLAEGGELITQWDLPSPMEWRARISEQNDGSMPREPYQRCSQAIFEAWLKPICEKESLIESHFGWKFEDLEEHCDHVVSRIVESSTGMTHIVKSKYVVGCDGAGSKVRKAAKINLTGGPVPAAMYLVHFKSRDLKRLHKQGQFWHIFFTNGGVIISQDEEDTWTTHLPVSLEENVDLLDPKESIYKVLGGSAGEFPITVDEVLVKSSWRPNLAVADEYISPSGRVFLAGDSAHQNIPTGGYGMNMGIGDAYDIGWKLAAVLKGYAGQGLFDSYTIERRPVALRNVERSGQHFSVHHNYIGKATDLGHDKIIGNTETAINFRQDVRDFVRANDGENKDHGIEMGYRLTGSPVIFTDLDGTEPQWSVRDYIPSTWPGCRAPHVFLADGTTSIMDLYGPEFTIVDFTSTGNLSRRFSKIAMDLTIPLHRLQLPNEAHAGKIWERDIVLVRPDGFVSWRSRSGTHSQDTMTDSEISHVLLVAVGKEPVSQVLGGKPEVPVTTDKSTFTASVGNVQQDRGEIKGMGAFQV